MTMRDRWYGMKQAQMDLLRCCGTTYLADRCIRNAVHTFEGKKYCDLHHPPDVISKQKKNKDPRCRTALKGLDNS